MKTSEILRAKGTQVHSIDPQSTLADVAQTLVQHNCGSLLVLDSDQLVGIITERDILRACAGDERPLAQIRVSEKMSTNLITGGPNDEVDALVADYLPLQRVVTGAVGYAQNFSSIAKINRLTLEASQGVQVDDL